MKNYSGGGLSSVCENFCTNYELFAPNYAMCWDVLYIYWEVVSSEVKNV